MSASACFTAAATGSMTGTRIRSRARVARPASGAPARIATSASRSAIASLARSTQRRPVRLARVLQRAEAAIERDDARAAAFEAVHRDAVAIPPAKRARESDDEESSAEHAGCQHRRLGDADHRKIEQFARAEKARIAESRKDRGVKPLAFPPASQERSRRRSEPRRGLRYRGTPAAP